MQRSPLLAPLAQLAGMHHERLDGTGYYRQARGQTIFMASRVLAAADAYQSMTQVRPHRSALTPVGAAAQLTAEAQKGQFDEQAVLAVLEAAGQARPLARRARPGGLSEREVEVLRLVAQGHTNRQIARQLVVSPRTAEHHVQHVYAKIGLSTRAGAALFAMEHGLLRQ